jgi:hypothetical protein
VPEVLNSLHGVSAPKGTPADIVALLNKKINAAVADATIKARLKELGALNVPPASPAELTQFIGTYVAKWSEVIKFAVAAAARLGASVLAGSLGFANVGVTRYDASCYAAVEERNGVTGRTNEGYA